MENGDWERVIVLTNLNKFLHMVLRAKQRHQTAVLRQSIIHCQTDLEKIVGPGFQIMLK